MKKETKKSKNKATLTTIVVLYDGFDMLDVSGPFAFFAAGGLNPVLAGLEKTRYKSGQGVEYVAQKSFAELGSVLEGDYILWVPGGYGSDYIAQFNKKNPLLKWLAEAGKKAKLKCSVCTGAHIAAASGLLKGCQVTTHWAFKEALSMFDLKILPDYPRFHYDKTHHVVTGGGISSGLDETLEIIALLAGKDVAMQAQLTNQYAPVPPFNAGTPATAPKAVYDKTVSDLSGSSNALTVAVNKFLS